jgi:hypothetical protein
MVVVVAAAAAAAVVAIVLVTAFYIPRINNWFFLSLYDLPLAPS